MGSPVSVHVLQCNHQGRASAFQGAEKAEAQVLVIQGSIGTSTDFCNEEFMLGKCENQGSRMGLVQKRKLINGHHHHSSMLRL